MQHVPGDQDHGVFKNCNVFTGSSELYWLAGMPADSSARHDTVVLFSGFCLFGFSVFSSGLFLF